MLSERTDTERINFYYDSDGSVVELGVQTRVSKDREWGSENRYFLVRNGQSDVVAIYRNDTSTLVGTYEYDPWGKVLSVKYAQGVSVGSNNDILNLNPFRYRGYYYDTETEFYYLNARYYDPQLKRFISADSVIAGISDSVTGYNLFAYCDNDPVNKTDVSGNFPEWSEIATSSNCKKVAIGVAVIAAVGVVCLATGGTATPLIAAGGAALKGAISSGVQSAALTAITGGSTDDVIVSFAEGAADGFMWGAITGAITGTIAEFTSGGGSSPACFVAGTIVQTLEGNTPIEQIKAGDYVLSKDEETGDRTYKRVLETYVRDENVLVHLIVEDEEIITTENHPFFVADKGFIIAKELAINDRLVTSDGTAKPLKLKKTETLKTPVKVYNFEVEDYHTYFVGSGILVHNMCKVAKTSNTLGKQGEDAVAKAYNLEKNKEIFKVNGKGRIPDFIDNNKKIIYEVKNVKYQAYTAQIKDYQRIASELGYKLKIVVREGDATEISKKLLQTGIEIINDLEF